MTEPCINATDGHAEEDLVLQGAWPACHIDLVARQGGDEFVLLLERAAH